MERTLWDEEQISTAADIKRLTGLDVTYVLGHIPIATRKGALKYARGVKTPKGVIVQADNPRASVRQIAFHEAMHHILSKHLGMAANIVSQIRQAYDVQEFERYVERYIQAIDGVYSVSDDMTDADLQYVYTRAVEELLCDAYASISSYGADAAKYHDAVMQILDNAETQTSPATDQQIAAAMKNNNAPPDEDAADRFIIDEVGDEVMTIIDVANDTKKAAVAESYLNKLISSTDPFATVLSDAQVTYVGRDLPGEYTRSRYTENLSTYLRAVKMQAATNLDEMVLLAENGRWKDNVKEKHNKDAKYGWYRYDTKFAVPIKTRIGDGTIDHYNVYTATLLMRNDADGKTYLYDLIDLDEIRKVPASPASSEDVPEFEADTSLKDNISQLPNVVKGDNSSS